MRKKRELMKQIIRNQRKRARDREKAKIEAALKLQRMQKARANWLKANNLDEEMLMKVKDPVEFLSALRLEHDYAKHPAFKGYDSKLRQTHEADKVHPCYYWYDESQHVVWHNKKNSRGKFKIIDVETAHPAMPNYKFQVKQMCNVTTIHPSMYLRKLAHKNPIEDALDSDDEEFYKKPINIPFHINTFFVEGLLSSNINGHKNVFSGTCWVRRWLLGHGQKISQKVFFAVSAFPMPRNTQKRN